MNYFENPVSIKEILETIEEMRCEELVETDCMIADVEDIKLLLYEKGR